MSAILKPQVPEVTFRRVTEQDIETVAAIERDVYAFPWTPGNFRDALLAGYRFWGCWHAASPERSAPGSTQGQVPAEELIGYAIIMLAVDEAHLLNIAVKREWQSRGVGRHMLHFSMEEARKHECVMLYLEVRPSNTSAIKLYESTGFRQWGVRRDYYPAHEGREDALFLGVELI